MKLTWKQFTLLNNWKQTYMHNNAFPRVTYTKPIKYYEAFPRPINSAE